MAQVRRFLDVWIVDSNTVYKEVPYAVVTDWIQQGRLLEDDKLKPSGTAEWFRLGGMPEFQAFLPKAEPTHAADQAEAMVPVEVDFQWKKKPDEEDDDVDMIPLIDVSLVLLIFFMMISTTAALAGTVATPEAKYGKILDESYWISIDADESGEAKGYVFGQQGGAVAEAADLNGFLGRLDAELAKLEGGSRIRVTIKAHRDLKAGRVRQVMVELEKRKDKIEAKYIGVSEGERA